MSGASNGGGGEGPQAPPRAFGVHPVQWVSQHRALLAGLGVFVLVTTVLGELRVLELWSTTWDLGLYQQALWSTAHGRPFYEAADLETGGYGSFLQVHSAIVLYAVVPFYAAFPSPLTLFLIQSVVVAAAALPLYALALYRTRSTRRALLLSLLYLVWAPTLAGALYDFHIEAFVPLTYLSAALFWETRRYGYATAATVIGFLTMEIVPVLLFFLAAFLLVDRVLETDAFRRDPGLRPVGRLRSIARTLVARPQLPLWCLTVASVAAYYALLVLRTTLLHDWFGFPSYPVIPTGYVTGGDPGSLGLSLSYLEIDLFGKLSYWVLLFALLGFLPLWSPRTVILIAPWAAFTFLSAYSKYTTLGFQYGLVAAGPIFVGAVWGLSRIPSPWLRAPSPAPRPRSRLGGVLRRARSPTFAVVALLVAANVAFSPLDPILPTTTPGSAYQITYAPTASAAGVRSLASLIPANGTVVASDDLFPLVANDLSAYSLFWDQNPNLTLPFGLTSLPDYVFLSEFRLPSVPTFLTATLYDPARYGVRGVAWGSPAGAVLLFERSYVGPTQSFGAAPSGAVTVPPVNLFTVTGLLRYHPDPTSPSGAYVASPFGAGGLIWNGPNVDFAAGTYTVSFVLRAVAAGGLALPAADDPVVTLAAGEFAEPGWFVKTLTYGELAGSVWQTVSFHVNVSAPTLSVTWPGYALDPGVEIDLAQITAVPSP